MQPLFSPFGLIQESIWPNKFLILVSCILLNCTSRKQVEKVMPVFIQRYNTPELLLKEDETVIIELLSPLGFKNRRTKTLYRLANVLSNNDWKNVLDLPGVGEYAARAWDIFVNGDLGTSPPKDGALKSYYEWRNRIKS